MRLITDNGHYLLVIRPDDPDLAVREAKRLADMPHATQADFDRLMKSQPYTVVGYLGTDRQIYSDTGAVIGRVQIGDSIVRGPLVTGGVPLEPWDLN